MLYPVSADQQERAWYVDIGSVRFEITASFGYSDEPKGGFYLAPFESRLSISAGASNARFIILCSRNSFYRTEGLILKRPDSGTRGEYRRVFLEFFF